MGVIFNPTTTDENGKNIYAYYEVYYTDSITKTKKHAKFSTNKYGKYAENLANHCFEKGERLKNWYTEENNKIIIHTYVNTINDYKDIIIDKDDFDLIKDYYWAAEKSGNEWYAITKINKNTKKYMHRIIMGEPKELQIDHIHGNGLNNTRNNLRIVTQQENLLNKGSIPKNNTSGIIGVGYHKGVHGYYKYDVTWTDKETGKTKHKSFSVNKYGNEEAKRLAKEYREKMIKANDYFDRDNH